MVVFVPFCHVVEYIAVFVFLLGDLTHFFPVCFTWNMLVMYSLYGKWNTLSVYQGFCWVKCMFPLYG